MTSSATSRGRAAESLAASHLEAKGYVVLDRNVRVGRDELDLVALDGETLVIVEVRARRAGAMVHPLESLRPAKLQRLRRAAQRYALQRGATLARVDVIAVVDGAVEHVESAVDFSEG